MGVQARGLVNSGWTEWTSTWGHALDQQFCMLKERFWTSRWGADYMRVWPVIVMVCQYAEFKLKWKTADESLGCTALPSHVLLVFIF